MSDMKQIELTFSRWGYRGKIIKRQGKVVIAEKNNGISPERKYYEVMILRLIPEHEFPGGNVVKEHEALPNAEQWGDLAWSCDTRPDADRVFSREVGNALKSIPDTTVVQPRHFDGMG